ncbi:MAG: hypothetical protein KZQ70_04715 [gamma proteobacterium symbiont of Lucinoma myriamae]|nr:hypothetical protein [gamma proteobacterium symbiont of Lucinoma myriamae]MCU7818481.1 hypothetical protein [gamma proteobacterium symbiont of Lucinoma myriamae]MCU7831857.1 hypothetical protein [gamma proteobacterium symbiont of Lucinoma myriamae]
MAAEVKPVRYLIVHRMIQFKHFNLLGSPLPATKFDFIFCRRILIYINS